MDMKELKPDEMSKVNGGTGIGQSGETPGEYWDETVYCSRCGRPIGGVGAPSFKPGEEPICYICKVTGE